jgi:hypothetical protein
MGRESGTVGGMSSAYPNEIVPQSRANSNLRGSATLVHEAF